VLLAQTDLAVMLGLPRRQVSDLLQEARCLTGQPLLTKGYYFDQGMRPSHKAEIIALYEQGQDETAIARQSGHTASSVGRYIRDYERVKMLLKRAIPVQQISHLLGLQPNVVDAYVKLVEQYHPELVSITKTSTEI
jgi:predicted transcriptional regulator